jgi:hypothetical protein
MREWSRIEEREVLIGLLGRMHENLPAVEEATGRYLERHHAAARRRPPDGNGR